MTSFGRRHVAYMDNDASLVPEDRGPTATVLRPGVYTSLQDGGRIGYRHVGLTVGGALDLDALHIANAIVANPLDSPAIECTGVGPEIRFASSVCLALYGGDFSVWVDEEPVPMGRPLWLSAGSILRIGAARSGYRTYLAVRGGFRVQRTLGSSSTVARFGIGGFTGAPIAAGDMLALAQVCEPFRDAELTAVSSHVQSTPWAVNSHAMQFDPLDLRDEPSVTSGPCLVSRLICSIIARVTDSGTRSLSSARDRIEWVFNSKAQTSMLRVAA